MEQHNQLSDLSAELQHRWHGWGSPVGLGIVIISVGLFIMSVGILIALAAWGGSLFL